MIQTWRSLSTFFFCTTEHCIEQHSLYNMMRVQKGAFTLPLPETFFLDPVHHCCVVVTVGSGEAVQCSGILIVSPGMALLARTRSANLRSFQLIFKLQVGSNNHPTKLVSLMFFKEAEWLCSKCQPGDALTCLVHCCTCLSVGMMLRLR